MRVGEGRDGKHHGPAPHATAANNDPAANKPEPYTPVRRGGWREEG
jgi:hypothetical protein